MKRKPIQITATGTNVLFALCSDGTIWQTVFGVSGWELIVAVPQPENHAEDPLPARNPQIESNKGAS